MMGEVKVNVISVFLALIYEQATEDQIPALWGDIQKAYQGYL